MTPERSPVDASVYYINGLQDHIRRLKASLCIAREGLQFYAKTTPIVFPDGAWELNPHPSGGMVPFGTVARESLSGSAE